jgi:nitroreductase
MDFEQFVDLVRARRTQLVMDLEKPVDRTMVEQLCSAAVWAPNHQLTWPWVFAVFTGDSRRKLGEAAADAMQARGDAEMKVAKTRTKYLRAPVIVVVGTLPGESELQTEENRDAVAAGIQNMLLGATALGLASFWSSAPKGANDAIGEVCGFAPHTHVTGVLYFGWPAREPNPGERPPPAITWFD